MPECDTCGDGLQDPRDKNTAGHWRDDCLPCIEDSAPDIESKSVIESEGYQDWEDKHD